MQSIRTEIIRYGKEAAILTEGIRYLIVTDDDPACEVETPLAHLRLLELLECLRYRPAGRDQGLDLSPAEALDELSTAAKAFLPWRQMLAAAERGGEAVQIDLVSSAAELATLPFEALRDDAHKPVFARSDRPLQLTRRIRTEFAEQEVDWPETPRILIISASPADAGQAVPLEAHVDALMEALRAWTEPLRLPDYPELVPDPKKVLLVIKRATLAKIREVCEAAVRDRARFSHVHVLAHGCKIGSKYREVPGVAFHADDGSDGPYRAATGEQLVDALAPIVGSCAAVTLAICEGGDATNVLVPGASLAHQLHRAGFPVVLASQLPLTFKGSVTLARKFYQLLLDGEDVRRAIHATRCALYECHPDTHDWASLVAYMRLPEGYAEYLTAVSLRRDLAALRTAQAWADQLEAKQIHKAAAHERVIEMIRARIGTLERFLKNAAGSAPRAMVDEARGLLGSAWKRLAELLHRRARLGDDAARWQADSRAALETARDWYRKAYQDNLSHHWSGVQQLSLEVVLDARLRDPGLWHAAVSAARIDARKAEECWAFGSLAELYLLAPFAGQPSRIDDAMAALRTLKQRVAASSDRFPLELTRRQFCRYETWWTHGHSYLPGSSGLPAEARRLIDEIDAA